MIIKEEEMFETSTFSIRIFVYDCTRSCSQQSWGMGSNFKYGVLLKNIDCMIFIAMHFNNILSKKRSHSARIIYEKLNNGTLTHFVDWCVSNLE